MNPNYLDFEQPIAELEVKIEELQLVGSDAELNLSDELDVLRAKSAKLTEKIFSNLSPWDVVRVARHPLRPYSLDYIPLIFEDFDELHGDRRFGDDKAIVGGLARLRGEPVMVIGDAMTNDIISFQRPEWPAGGDQDKDMDLVLGQLSPQH